MQVHAVCLLVLKTDGFQSTGYTHGKVAATTRNIFTGPADRVPR
jgi:hypothetical protein